MELGLDQSLVSLPIFPGYGLGCVSVCPFSHPLTRDLVPLLPDSRFVVMSRFRYLRAPVPEDPGDISSHVWPRLRSPRTLAA